MYFKSIELNGFKSFVEHTNIAFGSGMTAIVGPNGCGKSNISDAIRWVLGEQRAKTLRGAKMEDFIFNGSTSRKPSGMAEVSITLADIAGLITRPELAEYNEVTVTRRLYRSGESEYMINKAPCRLKDIVDLFLDTGISTRAFSIIEQDQVQRIVTSKPEDRRFIVEEAAGIMKYKHRRHAALNKLAGSTQNLERVNDIVSELERQRNSLKRQSSKAERYKQYKTEAAQLFLAVSADEWTTLKATEQSTARELEQMDERRTALETEIATWQNELITLQASIDEQGRAMSGLKETEYHLTSGIEKSEGKIHLYAEQIEEAANVVKLLGDEVLELDRRMDEMHRDLQAETEMVETLRRTLEEKMAELDQKRSELRGDDEAIEAINADIVSKETALTELAGTISQNGNALASMKTRLEMLEKRFEGIEREKGEAREAAAQAQTRIEEMEAAIRTRNEGYNRLQEEQVELQNKRSNLIWIKEEKEKAIAQLRTSIAERSARLESLMDVERAREGYQDGVRSLLALKESNVQIAEILHGTLLDRIKVNPDYEKALELLLGEKLQAVVIRNSGDALNAIATLRDREMGRGTFLPLDMRHDDDQTNLPEGDGVIGRAVDMIEASDDIRTVLATLLRGVVLVRDLATALALRSDDLTMVTPQGDVVDRFGVISGGSAGKQGTGLLERKRMIEELNETVQSDERKLALFEEEREQNALGLKELETLLEEKNRAVKEEEVRLIGEHKDLESLGAELQRHEARLETYRAETDRMEVDKDNHLREIGDLERTIEDLHRQKAELQEAREALRSRQREARERHEALKAAVSETEVALASMKGNVAVAEAGKRRLENSLTELSQRLATIRDNITLNNEKKKRLEDETETLKGEIHTMLEERHRVSAQVKEIAERLEEAGTELKKREGELSVRKTELEVLKERQSETKMKHSETTIRMTNLLERAEEQNTTQEEIENFVADEDINIAECRERLVELRDKLSKIGDVNLAAIEDYNQVMERLTFLTTQRDDLLESINDIKKVIEKLNRTTKKLFEETYLQVSANFRETFKRLFKGGEAEMVMTDEENALESGIDIIVRPPGKRRQNITLLSAGEKAMTAVAILFSVFMVKPSPFCLLDEVDAPLDEANIGRFRDILREFEGKTQFLVITHSQRTMSYADRLYGITMQEPGISTVLSVDLVDGEIEPRERRLHVVGE